MKKFILVSIAAVALFVVLGSIGAYDNNTIGFGQLLIQCGISVLAECFALRELNK